MHSRLLFLSFFSTLLHLQASPPPPLRRSRRALHTSLFPKYPSSSLPPTQPPSSPSFPKYPSASSSSAFPFFPVYSSPPPPPPPPPPSPTSSIPTFPANFYSLPSPSRQSHPHHLSPAIFFPLLSLALVGLSLALLLHIRRRRRAAAEGSRGESLRLFPPGAASSSGRKPQSNHSSEFLYVGTLLNSASAGAGSPELRPLPPLPPLRKADVGFPSGEEKSPRKCNGAPTAMDSSEETVGDYARNPFVVGPLEGQNPKLKPLHWDKVRASVDNEMLWAARFREQVTKPQDIAK